MTKKFTHRIVRARTNEEKGYYEGALCSEHASRALAEKALRRLESMSNKSMRGAFRIEEIRDSNPGRATHTAKFDRCVKSVKRRLKGVSNPYAVCMAAMGKKALRKKR